MAVREEDVVDDDRLWWPLRDARECVQDRLVSAGGPCVDQVEAVTLTDGIRLHDRRPQAPEPARQLDRLDARHS
jgi:hypothetical protein